ncbi:hypothetical protein ACFUAC_02890 [Streptomyces sp. NPDC057148]|uniref:hypothetical protein n=1 Tax=unclassified Streptomyces TaxID=2593676 RepID=UPI00364387E6
MNARRWYAPAFRRRVAALAHDPDNQVRAAIVARAGLDPVLRESVSVGYDDRSSGDIVEWLLAEDLSESDQVAFARSRHQDIRKTLAMRTDLTDEAVGVLAVDESFAVRLFVCERQPNAPGWRPRTGGVRGTAWLRGWA